MSIAPNEMPVGSFQIDWGVSGTRIFEAGVDRGVVYIDGIGYPWTGLVSVEETPEGGGEQSYYLDGMKYYNGSLMEEFKASIEAYTYPDEFMYCDGSASILPGVTITQQRRKSFDFCYRTRIGNDVDGLNYGYKLHLVYDAKATPTSKSHQTLGESSDLSTFSWTISTRRKRFQTNGSLEARYGAHLVIDSRNTTPSILEALENTLYGKTGASGTQAKMPTPKELYAIFGEVYEDYPGLIVDSPA